MTNQWGNPELKSFKNNHIRRVMVDLARVFVNRKITVETEDLLMRASDYGATFSKDGLPTNLPAYDMDDTELARLGLKVQIPEFTKNIDAGDFGFEQDGDIFVFVGETTDTPSEPQQTKLQGIGNREIGLGDTGLDVDWIIQYLQPYNVENIKEFDHVVEGYVRTTQQRMGIAVTGRVDAQSWKSFLPKISDRILETEAGRKVRALQAALKVHGYPTPVDGRFGILTVRALRDFQADNNLRVQPKAGMMEWNLLFPS
ncbi:MAG: peptidoglycan-binding domain-containing protein [Patescibacteria group bacterium]